MPEEMTNQSVESTESATDELMFDEVAETTDSSETESSENNEAKETPKESPFLKIRYNGADEDLTQEQAVELAQKGRNYDKIYQRLQDLQNDPTRAVFEEQAQSAGLTLQEYANRLKEFQQASAINKIAKEFMAKNPDATEEIAKQYAQSEYRNQEALKAQQKAQEAQRTEQERQSRAQEQVAAFVNEYPDVNIRELPQEVVDDINKNGETLLSAYRRYENKQLRAELAAARKNNSNRSKATGNLTDNAGSSTAGDPFLQGLLGK